MKLIYQYSDGSYVKWESPFLRISDPNTAISKVKDIQQATIFSTEEFTAGGMYEAMLNIRAKEKLTRFYP